MGPLRMKRALKTYRRIGLLGLSTMVLYLWERSFAIDVTFLSALILNIFSLELLLIISKILGIRVGAKHRIIEANVME